MIRRRRNQRGAARPLRRRAAQCHWCKPILDRINAGTGSRPIDFRLRPSCST